VGDYVNDTERINRLRQDKSFYSQSGWAHEVSDRRPTPPKEWVPPVAVTLAHPRA
jgi:hypothetical protein